MIQNLNISGKIIQVINDLWFICFRLKLLPSMIVNEKCIYPDTILLNINPYIDIFVYNKINKISSVTLSSKALHSPHWGLALGIAPPEILCPPCDIYFSKNMLMGYKISTFQEKRIRWAYFKYF